MKYWGSAAVLPLQLLRLAEALRQQQQQAAACVMTHLCSLHAVTVINYRRKKNMQFILLRKKTISYE